MLGYYNYTVILTYLSLASSIFGIYSCFTYENGSLIAIWCLMLSGFCDMFDGAVARMCKHPLLNLQGYAVPSCPLRCT